MAVVRRQCAKCGVNRQLKFYPRPASRICSRCQRARTRKYNRGTHLEEVHGIDQATYDLILELQGDQCFICPPGHPLPRYRLDVDHDHALEKQYIEEGYEPLEAHRKSIRGLLCKQHNRRLLPSVRDNVETLRRAIEYLESPPARFAL